MQRPTGEKDARVSATECGSGDDGVDDGREDFDSCSIKGDDEGGLSGSSGRVCEERIVGWDDHGDDEDAEEVEL